VSAPAPLLEAPEALPEELDLAKLRAAVWRMSALAGLLGAWLGATAMWCAFVFFGRVP
jgi:hypothetical protein